MNNLNYGVIGNCRSAALVDQHGSIDWCCLPNFDSASVFASLLDKEKGGFFKITGVSTKKIQQSYIRKTNILKTTFTCEDGEFIVIDFMPRYVNPHNDYHTPAEIVRIIYLVRGKPKLKIDYQPRLAYAKYETKIKVYEDYIKSTSEDIQEGSYESLYLYSSLSLQDIAESKEITLEKSEFILVNYNQKIEVPDMDSVELDYENTKVYWLNWSAHTTKFKKYQDEIDRSALALKLLTYQKTGAILAAITTSLPETIGEVRNWDYRFCWLRDASMTITILHKLEHYTVAERFIEFILRILPYKNDRIQIMYGINGEKILEEKILDWLDGYEGSKPVRIGNAAYSQRQNDIYGVLIDMVYQHLAYSKIAVSYREEIWTVVRTLLNHVKHNWDKSDSGLWEFRGASKHFVFSKVLCWVAMDRAAKIAKLFNKPKYSHECESLANTIKKDVLEKGWNEDLGLYTQAYGENKCDASNLLMEHYGFVTADDPKYRSTVLKTYELLCKDGLMIRYNIVDDFGMPTSSFTVCSFWMVKSLYRIGEKEKAQKMFDQLLSYRNHVGLMGEDIEIETKRLLGNFPQGYSHLAIIDTALTLMGIDTKDIDLELTND